MVFQIIEISTPDCIRIYRDVNCKHLWALTSHCREVIATPRIELSQSSVFISCDQRLTHTIFSIQFHNFQLRNNIKAELRWELAGCGHRHTEVYLRTN